MLEILARGIAPTAGHGQFWFCRRKYFILAEERTFLRQAGA
jgi:hypothetical protein